MYRNRFGHFLAQASALVGLALLFLVTGAPGGGFGGGYGGGFGAGGGGGMTGGRSGGSGRSSFDSPIGAMFLLTLFCLSVCVSLWWAARDWKRDRGRRGTWEVIQIALVLEGADASVRVLDTLVRDSSFVTPAGRRAGLAEIATLVTNTAVVDGFFQRSGALSDPLTAAKAAEQRARVQMKRVDLAPETVNLAADGWRVESRNQQTISLPERTVTTDGACVLVVTSTAAPALAASIAQSEMGAQTAILFRKLAAQVGGDIDAVYIYFAPAPGEALSRSDALRMLTALRDAGPASQ